MPPSISHSDFSLRDGTLLERNFGLVGIGARIMQCTALERIEGYGCGGGGASHIGRGGKGVKFADAYSYEACAEASARSSSYSCAKQTCMCKSYLPKLLPALLHRGQMAKCSFVGLTLGQFVTPTKCTNMRLG
eukprot:4268695-Amphidinium_carterae.1